MRQILQIVSAAVLLCFATTNVGAQSQIYSVEQLLEIVKSDTADLKAQKEAIESLIDLVSDEYNDDNVRQRVQLELQAQYVRAVDAIREVQSRVNAIQNSGEVFHESAFGKAVVRERLAKDLLVYLFGNQLSNRVTSAAVILDMSGFFLFADEKINSVLRMWLTENFVGRNPQRNLFPPERSEFVFMNEQVRNRLVLGNDGWFNFRMPSILGHPKFSPISKLVAYIDANGPVTLKSEILWEISEAAKSQVRPFDHKSTTLDKLEIARKEMGAKILVEVSQIRRQWKAENEGAQPNKTFPINPNRTMAKICKGDFK